jgi:hypothetical protein
MLHHDGRFVDAVIWCFTADRRGSTGVQTKFEASDRAASAFGVIAIPVDLDDRSKFGTKVGCKVIRD